MIEVFNIQPTFLEKSMKKDESSQTVSFEHSIDELTGTIQQLENGNLSLTESLQGYEKGVKLIRQCQQALDQAQQTIRMVEDSQLNSKINND